MAPRSVVATTLNGLTQRRPLAVMVVTALILAVLYWVMKQRTLGILLRIREIRAGQHHFDWVDRQGLGSRPKIGERV